MCERGLPGRARDDLARARFEAERGCCNGQLRAQTSVGVSGRTRASHFQTFRNRSQHRMPELTGHVSPDTAYVVADYPYGFRLRPEIRYRIETQNGQGQRVMSQTRNPKVPGMPWNRAKGSTYNA